MQAGMRLLESMLRGVTFAYTRWARARRATRSRGDVAMPKGTEKKKTNNKPKLTVKEKKEKKKKAKTG